MSLYRHLFWALSPYDAYHQIAPCTRHTPRRLLLFARHTIDIHEDDKECKTPDAFARRYNGASQQAIFLFLGQGFTPHYY